MKPSQFSLSFALMLGSAAALAVDNSTTIPASTVQVQPQSTSIGAGTAAAAPSVVVAPVQQDLQRTARTCETGSRIRSASCTSVVRTYSGEDLSMTGQTNVGSALNRLDPAVNYSGH